MRREEIENVLIRLENGVNTHLRWEIEGTCYIRRFFPVPRLLILGGGHIAKSLCPIAAMMGFAVTIVDDRPEFADHRRFPTAYRIICGDYEDAIGSFAVKEGDYVCILTRGHRFDGLCLRETLAGDQPGYLGMLGSRRRVIEMKKMLGDEGFDKNRIEALHAPIGLQIGAQTPEEIAIAIAGELIQERRSALAADGFPETNPNVEVLRLLRDSPRRRSMLLVLETRGSTPVKAGTMMAVDEAGNTLGTIGGGCGEAELIYAARQYMGRYPQEIAEVDMSGDVRNSEGMVCGGTMQVLIEEIEGSP